MLLGARGIDASARCVEKHPVNALRQLNAELLVEHVLQDMCGIAEARRSVSSGSRNLHLQHIAVPRRQRDLWFERLGGSIAHEMQAGRSTWHSAGEAIREEISTIRPDLDRDIVREKSYIAAQREPAPELPCAPRVRNERIGLNTDWRLRFGKLHRSVGHIAGRVGDRLLAVPALATSPGPLQNVEVDKRVIPAWTRAAERDHGHATLAGGRDALRQCLGEGAEQRVDNAEAGEAAGAAGGGVGWIDDAALGGNHADRPEVTFVVRQLLVNHRA